MFSNLIYIIEFAQDNKPKLVEWLRNKVCKLLFFLILLLVSHPIFSQLTASSKISLVTIGPGKELYSSFGHSALHISDPELGIDDIYNYGTFSFAKGFYIKFIKGELDYMLSVVPFKQEYYTWTTLENRTVIEQVLNLTLNQRNELFKFLEKNALSENCMYRYDYFYDNCSNRIDEALKIVFGDSLKSSSESVVKKQNKIGATIRQLTHNYLLQNQWGELGIETCLGIDMDKKITPEQFKFLPDYLMWNYDEAKIKSNGVFVPLLKEKITLFKTLDQSYNASSQNFLSPILIFSIVLGLALIFSVPIIHETFFARLFHFILFFTSGTVGLLVIFLWFFTTHHSQVNLNILWANPANFFLSFLIFSKKYKLKLSSYYLIYGLLLVLVVVFWSILPQRLNNAYIIICLALILRCLANYWLSKNIKVN